MKILNLYAGTSGIRSQLEPLRGGPGSRFAVLKPNAMNHGSLFSGIGGFDLAAQWIGWENIFHCEWNEFGKRALSYYWPNAISYHDITKTDFTIHRGTIDVLTGGFPCQPYSTAGKRLGKADARHLWPEMLRAIREIRPTWVVGENVRGLVSWNGGLVFEEVQADLEAAGYEVLAFVLPACGVNAPHRRDRIWFVAHACSEQCAKRSNFNRERADAAQNSPGVDNRTTRPCPDGHAPDSCVPGLPECEQKREPHRSIGESFEIPGWDRWPTQSPVCGGDDGLPRRLDGITFSKWRNESIKAYGNAIVPQVAYQIFKAINLYEKMRY